MSKRAEVPPDPRIPSFVERVLASGLEHYRDLPWRNTADPYAILVSEIMLQQTQVARVAGYWERWLADFPDLESLAAAPLEAVLRNWQGLGYNRRAIALKRAAEEVVARPRDGGVGADDPGIRAELPREEAALRALPGIGPATAAGVRAFAWGEPGVYLETNSRTVVIHELFEDSDSVSDREIIPVLAQAAAHAASTGVGAREWNLALLDYGAHLKRTQPNPSRRSTHHAKQSRFEGSNRQKRATLLRAVMASPGQTAHEHASDLAKRIEISGSEAETLLESLAAEGFLVREADGWFVA